MQGKRRYAEPASVNEFASRLAAEGTTGSELAERAGFEPALGIKLNTLSRHAT